MLERMGRKTPLLFLNKGKRMEEIRDYLKFQVHRNNSRLAKGLLAQIEIFKAHQNDALNRLLDKVPAQFHKEIKDLLIFDNERFSIVRKHILDSVGESNRELTSELENFDISLRKR